MDFELYPNGIFIQLSFNARGSEHFIAMKKIGPIFKRKAYLRKFIKKEISTIILFLMRNPYGTN
jgi:hypothetical protein